MSDIVELLHDLAACKHSDLSVAAEAATKITRLTAEVERLRAALESIARYEVPPVDRPWTHEVAADTYWKGIDYMRSIAGRAALTSQPSQEKGEG